MEGDTRDPFRGDILDEFQGRAVRDYGGLWSKAEGSIEAEWRKQGRLLREERLLRER